MALSRAARKEDPKCGFLLKYQKNSGKQRKTGRGRMFPKSPADPKI